MVQRFLHPTLPASKRDDRVFLGCLFFFSFLFSSAAELEQQEQSPCLPLASLFLFFSSLSFSPPISPSGYTNA
ncbi:hypothetical protein F4775DRAFT_561184, partial [Biscogniauxia sp. FL1348]